MERFGNQAASQITLTASVASGDLTWPISALGVGAFVIPNDGVFSLICEDEIVKVTAVSALNLTVVRAQEGTTAAAHASGTRVYHWLTKRSMGTLMQRYAVDFSAQTTVTILGTTHDFDFSTEPPVIQAWNSASPVVMIQPDSISYSELTGDVTVTFAAAESGTIVVLGRP